VYAGHAAIALALKARDPRVPIIPLTLACYGPDWIDMALMFPKPREGMAIYSHSLPAVAIGALAASALFALVARRPGAMSLLIGWLLHWPVDFLTGVKPLIGLDTMVGLDLYHLPAADFAVETVVIVAACLYYLHRRAAEPRQRRTVVALGGALILLQMAFLSHIVRADHVSWHPLLAWLR
jgi:hypothetical protein